MVDSPNCCSLHSVTANKLYSTDNTVNLPSDVKGISFPDVLSICQSFDFARD